MIIECHVKHALHVTRNMRYNSKNIRSWGSVPILLWNMSTASKTNKNKYLFMIHGVCKNLVCLCGSSSVACYTIRIFCSSITGHPALWSSDVFSFPRLQHFYPSVHCIVDWANSIIYLYAVHRETKDLPYTSVKSDCFLTASSPSLNQAKM